MVTKCIHFTVSQVTRRAADSERVQCSGVRILGLACAGLRALSPSCIPSQKSVLVKSRVEFSPEIIPLSFKKSFLPLILPLFQILSDFANKDSNTMS